MSSTPQVHQTINGHFGRVPHDGVPSERAISTLGDRQKRQRTSGDTVSDTIKDLLGDMNMTQVTSRNLDVHQGYPHTTTGARPLAGPPPRAPAFFCPCSTPGLTRALWLQASRIRSPAGQRSSINK